MEETEGTPHKFKIERIFTQETRDIARYQQVLPKSCAYSCCFVSSPYG